MTAPVTVPVRRHRTLDRPDTSARHAPGAAVLSTAVPPLTGVMFSASQSLPLMVYSKRTVPLAPLGAALGLALGETEADGLTLPDGDTDAEGDGDRLTDAEGLAEPLGLAEADGDTDRLGEDDGLAEPLGLTEALGLALPLGEIVGLAEALGLLLPLGLAVPEADPDGLTLGLTDDDGDALPLAASAYPTCTPRRA